MTHSRESSRQVVLSESVLNFFHLVYKVISWSPWVWLGFLGVFVLIVTSQAGHFPTYGQPDPKYTGTVSLFYIVIMALFASVFWAIPIGLFLLAFLLWKRPFRPITIWQVIWHMAGIMLFSLVTFGDLAGLMTWLAD